MSGIRLDKDLALLVQLCQRQLHHSSHVLSIVAIATASANASWVQPQQVWALLREVVYRQTPDVMNGSDLESWEAQRDLAYCLRVVDNTHLQLLVCAQRGAALLLRTLGLSNNCGLLFSRACFLSQHRLYWGYRVWLN